MAKLCLAGPAAKDFLDILLDAKLSGDVVVQLGLLGGPWGAGDQATTHFSSLLAFPFS